MTILTAGGGDEVVTEEFATFAMLLHLMEGNLQADGLVRRREIDGLMDNRYILSRMDTCGDIEWL